MKQVVMFNPFTGQPRDPRDIQSDPYGQLIWDGETPLQAARAAVLADRAEREKDAERLDWLDAQCSDNRGRNIQCLPGGLRAAIDAAIAKETP